MEEFDFDRDEELSLLETLDHVLDKGLVLAGDITISVATIDLIYVGLNVLLGSVETVNEVLGRRGVFELPPGGETAAPPEDEGGGEPSEGARGGR